ncbi:hypothetical protein [Phytopseudomonas daroniae]|uniref:hypothetical protein n=1 Tax=Phytopseudomonas daroniae TaxID=2487519 RepID=UPI0010383500|nr:hypothetical protein [Pseudomonas daroniae]TBU74012.1 hypothetical protein DNK10_15270 [Pseudomonas daroniae]
MLDAYFVVSHSSGNIIRVTRRNARPADSATVTHVYASLNHLERYERLFAAGQDLISVDNVLHSEAEHSTNYIR